MSFGEPKPFTHQDMRDQLRSVLGATAGTYDASKTLAALVKEFGVCDLDTISNADFWRIVGQRLL